MIKHSISEHRKGAIHLREIDPDTQQPKGQNVKFANVLDYNTDVSFPVYKRENREWIQTHQIKLSKLLKYPKPKNIIYDSLHRHSKGKYTWKQFQKERDLKLLLIGASPMRSKPTPPSEIIERLLENRPHKRSEIKTSTGMTKKEVKTCLRWMRKNNKITCDPHGYFSLAQTTGDTTS